MYRKKFGRLLACVLLLLPLIGCPMYTAVGFKYAESSEEEGGQTQGSDPQGIEVSGPTATIAWDEPFGEIDSYRVVLRIHGEDSWFVLQEEHPIAEYTLDSAIDDHGIYDIGVVAKDYSSETEESALHTSLDVTAQPDSGWYLIWTP
jgi:hypothetical protein